MSTQTSKTPPDTGQPTTPVLWRFYLLGGLEIFQADRPIPAPPHRAHSLLALLLLEPGPQRRQRLASLLFPDKSERAGRRRLSDLLWLIRRSLPDLPVQATNATIGLPVSSRWLDVEALKEAGGEEDLNVWQAALDLYRGELLPSCAEECLLLEREALHLEYVGLMQRTCHRLLERQRFRAALPWLQRLARQEPFDEGALRMLMQTHVALGQRGPALEAYDRFVGLAADELGVEPDEATQALAQSIQAAAPVLLNPPPALPPDASPEILLEQGRSALERGDRVSVERYLAELDGLDIEAVHLLQVDLALFCQDHAQAERLLNARPPERSTTLIRRAALALSQGQGGEAQELASRALLLAHDEQAPQSELEALLNLARAQVQQGHYLKASSTVDQALRLASRMTFPAGMAQAHLVQGRALSRQGRYRESAAAFHLARALAHEHGLRRYLAEAYSGIGVALVGQGALLKALTDIQQALSIWRDLGIKRQEAKLLHHLAIVYSQLGRNTEGLHAIQCARQIHEQLGNQLGVAKSQYNLAAAMPYYEEALAEWAIPMARAALAVFREHQQTGWEAATLATLGYNLWLDEQHQAALDALSRAQTLYEKLGEMEFVPELLAYQGLAYLGLGEPKQALAHTRQALLALAQGPLENEIASEIYYAHATALLARGQPDKARDYLSRAYHNLLEYAAQFEEEAARQAFFRRDPTMRRLMDAVYAQGIAPNPQAGVVTQWLPSQVEPAQRLVPVEWTLDAGPPDVALKRAKGSVALRRSRLARILSQAEAQGAQPTIRQLADALGVSSRTIKRDLAALRRADDTSL